MRVLIGCEKSGKTREAFRKLGHDAWSCDLEPADDYSPSHYQGDLLNYLSLGWDLLIAHPPCTHLALSGARWCTDHWVENKKKGRWWWDGSEKRRMRDEAVKFFRILLDYEAIPLRCLENPMSMASTLVAPKTQIIHPWQFGHGEKKETWLWLRNLPPLVPTDIVEGRDSRVHKMPPSKDRGAQRSVSYQGISNAMANQWGGICH